MNEWFEYQLGDAPKAKKPPEVPKAGISKGKETLRKGARRDSDLNGQGHIGEWEGKVLNEMTD